MKIRAPTAVAAAARLLECEEAVEPYVSAILRMVDKDAPAHATVPEYCQLKKAAREVGWSDQEIDAAIDMLTIRHTTGDSAPARAGKPSA